MSEGADVGHEIESGGAADREAVGPGGSTVAPAATEALDTPAPVATAAVATVTFTLTDMLEQVHRLRQVAVEWHYATHDGLFDVCEQRRCVRVRG